LTPFKKIWDRDKSKTKDQALSELAYVFYMDDFKSDFADIVNEDDRRKEVLNNINLKGSWEEDEYIKIARSFYKSSINNILPLLFLRDAQTAVNQMRLYFRTVDFTKKDSKGKLLEDVTKLVGALKASAEILENLNVLENMVKKELEAKDDKVGGKSKALYEDGIK
jgi:hypothetical protein